MKLFYSPTFTGFVYTDCERLMFNERIVDTAALVEEINEHDASLVTGRLSNNTLVHFKGDTSLIGHIVPVCLTEAKGFYYLGELV